ncbi:NAD(P)-dependent oxidoreductase [Pelagibacterales bacterium SAG-MED47]|nr:NAD(P)-dependent oxidoreductase [Pelagibacterales bacterium SAG-MED47]
MKNKKKLLVVGGTGFLGFHLSKEALKKGWSVTSLSSNKPKKIRYLKKVKYLVCNISKKKEIDKIKLNFDHVVNFGGYVDHKDKSKTYKSHFVGCKNLANHFCKKKIFSFIQIGSCIEYGFTKSPQNENSSTSINKLNSVYGKSKLMASNYLMSLYKKKKFPVIILRPYLIYGPFQDINRFIPIIINGCLKDQSFKTSNGKQKRDFLYVTDFINLIFKVLKNQNFIGEIFNVGSGKPQVLKKIISLIKKNIKKGNPKFGKIKLRKDEILNLYPNISKVKKKFNWSPKINFNTGLKKTIKFYKTKRI